MSKFSLIKYLPPLSHSFITPQLHPFIQHLKKWLKWNEIFRVFASFVFTLLSFSSEAWKLSFLLLILTSTRNTIWIPKLEDSQHEPQNTNSRLSDSQANLMMMKSATTLFEMRIVFRRCFNTFFGVNHVRVALTAHDFTSKWLQALEISMWLRIFNAKQ